MKTLRVQNLVRKFGQHVVVDNVSFSVRAGEFLTLLGPSGCGKTSLLRCIAGLDRPAAGRIDLGDVSLTDADRGLFLPPERRGMGMVFQSYAIWPHMNVFENVAFPLREARVDAKELRARVMDVLSTVGLSHLHDRGAPLLSGGQQQRVALARALVSKPDVLLLDEPLSNLDAKLRDEMRHELREMQAKLGITSILVTHDHDEALTLSDRVLIIRDGRIEQQGDPRELYEQPQSAFVMDFLGDVNQISTAVVERGGRMYAAAVGSSHPFEIELQPGHKLKTGDKATLAFRPTDVGLVKADADAGHAVVDAVIYKGNRLEYIMALGTTRLRVVSPLNTGISTGEWVRLSYDPSAMRVWRT